MDNKVGFWSRSILPVSSDIGEGGAPSATQHALSLSMIGANQDSNQRPQGPISPHMQGNWTRHKQDEGKHRPCPETTPTLSIFKQYGHSFTLPSDRLSGIITILFPVQSSTITPVFNCYVVIILPLWPFIALPP